MHWVELSFSFVLLLLLLSAFSLEMSLANGEKCIWHFMNTHTHTAISIFIMIPKLQPYRPRGFSASAFSSRTRVYFDCGGYLNIFVEKSVQSM